ncbi:MAG TPA: hypothetical protein VGU25_01575 [Acidobacteriaceae bacterium]|nr:hypothetical protein [Acidobacteriaceae bacterium]
MGRSILALLAGFIAEPLLVVAADWIFARAHPGAFTPEGHVAGTAAIVVLIYVQVINAISGYITGRIAPQRPALHAFILGIVGFVLCVIVSAYSWNAQPHWYLLGGILLAIPSTTLGGYLAGL